MGLLLAFAVLSIAVSFLCSILEAALLSITPSFIAQQKALKPRLHERLRVLKDQIDQPLAAILTLNTVAHTVGATGVGAQVTIVFGDGYLGIASAVMTVLILMLSEIVPKTIGARYWRALAPWLPMVLQGMIVILKPFIWMSDLLITLFGNKAPEHDVRQEIKAMAVLGQELNLIDNDEQRVIANVIDLHEKKARDIMTPRTVCERVDVNDSLDDFLAKLKESQFSRFPVMDSSEAPLGVALRRDMLNLPEDAKVVGDIMVPVKVVNDQMNVEQVMREMMKGAQHLCLVYDEYGTWQGLITMEDILETILGQPIVDESDRIPNMRRFARARWEHRQKQVLKDD